MKAWVQRVTEASVTIDGEKVAEIGKGYLVLLGVTHGDTEAAADKIAAQISKEYKAKFGDEPVCSVIQPSDGAHLV